MTWHDTGGAAEARSLEAMLGPSEPLLGTDLPWSASFPPAKLAWLARHEPRTVGATRFVLQVKDYLGLCLTGTAISDAWSSKGLCNVLTGKAALEVMTACGWDPVVVPEIRPAWAPRGRLTSEAARRFGLPEGTPVAVGWSDALAGFLAVGAFHRPCSVIILGTSNIVGLSINGPLPGHHPGLLTVPNSVTPLPLVYGPTQNGGSALAWVGRLLDRSVAEVLDGSLAATGDVPVFTPYLAGERTPVWDPDVRAGLVNLSERTGQAELCRAVVRGVVASTRHVLDETEALIGGPVGPEVVIGGYGADHPAWQLAFAEQLGRPFATVAGDVSVVGASMLAAAAAGERIEDLPLVIPTAPVAPTSLDMGAGLQRAYLRLSRAVLAETHAENPSGPGAPPAKLGTSNTGTTYPPSTVTPK
jgi:xylulokinase